MREGPTIALPARQLFEIPDAGAMGILCTAGCVWITLDDDVRDVVLHPGDRFEATDSRRALIYAFEPSAFTLLAEPRSTVRDGLSKDTPDWKHAPVVWAATRAASSA